jgi:hypothetical protein
MDLPAHSGPWPLIQFRNHFSQTVGLLGRLISPSQCLYLNTGQHKHRINAHNYPCLEWESNPQSQRQSERRQFMVTVISMISEYYHLINFKIPKVCGIQKRPLKRRLWNGNMYELQQKRLCRINTPVIPFGWRCLLAKNSENLLKFLTF